MATALSRPGLVHVETDEVCVHYGTTVALAPTSIRLSGGSSVALVGSNGSGKTTLLATIAGLVRPTAGSIRVSGSVAMVTQTRQHHRWMPLTVDEVLRMGRYQSRGLVGRLRRSDRDILDAAAARLEVQQLRRRPFGALSGGQQQRVLVAQALASEPDILLLDEPITGLDLPSQLTILDVIADHAEAGGLVVFSTHHLSEAHRAGRVLLMAGCVLADGAPDEVLTPALLAEAFGGRLMRDRGTSILIDDHGHEHGGWGGQPTHAELVPHHGLHHHDHDHDHNHHHDHDGH